MKKIIGYLVSTFLVSSVLAGPIISGGVSQLLEVCKTKNSQIRLNIKATIDGNIVLELADYSSLKSVFLFNDLVQADENGYSGLNSKIVFQYYKGKKIATVMIESTEFSKEPLVFQNVLCKNSMK